MCLKELSVFSGFSKLKDAAAVVATTIISDVVGIKRYVLMKIAPIVYI